MEETMFVHGSLLPWWAPEEMELREATMVGSVTGFFLRSNGFPLGTAQYHIIDYRALQLHKEGLDRLNRAIANALPAAIRWNGCPEPREPEPDEIVQSFKDAADDEATQLTARRDQCPSGVETWDVLRGVGPDEKLWVVVGTSRDEVHMIRLWDEMSDWDDA